MTPAQAYRILTAGYTAAAEGSELSRVLNAMWQEAAAIANETALPGQPRSGGDGGLRDRVRGG